MAGLAAVASKARGVAVKGAVAAKEMEVAVMARAGAAMGTVRQVESLEAWAAAEVMATVVVVMAVEVKETAVAAE